MLLIYDIKPKTKKRHKIYPKQTNYVNRKPWKRLIKYMKRDRLVLYKSNLFISV